MTNQADLLRKNLEQTSCVECTLRTPDGCVLERGEGPGPRIGPTSYFDMTFICSDFAAIQPPVQINITESGFGTKGDG